MDLFFRKFGEGTPLIIVHGLYGSSDNWLSIGKELGKNFEVYLLRSMPAAMRALIVSTASSGSPWS
jgi:pimeloyl-ACP methyl ester carboxylesterase